MTVVWNDEFNGTSLDPAKWQTCPEWTRQGGSYWEADNLSLNGAGKLTLKVTERNDSVFCGAIRTRGLFEQKYGYFEVRCKVPQIHGGWAAFWLMPRQNKPGNQGNDGTEIDVFESINGWNGKVNHAVHWDGYGVEHQKASQSADRPDIYDNAYHKFGMKWTPTEYIFYVDDQESWRTSAGGISDVAQYLKLTLEVSSDTWPGNWGNQTTKPINWMVDYVRVYKELAPANSFTCEVKDWSYGMVVKSPEADQYEEGTAVQLSAQADPGFQFNKWYGTVESETPVLSVSMDQDYELIPEFIRSEEMMSNSQFFDGNTSWSARGAETAVDTGIFFTSIVAATTNPWDIQLTQGGLTFESAKVYSLTIVASSSVNRSIVVALGMNRAPWTSYGSKTLSLNSDPTTFSFDLLVNASDADGRVVINLGKELGNVWLKEVSMVKKVVTGLVQFPSKQDFLVWPNPVDSYLNLVLKESAQLEVFDQSAKQVFSGICTAGQVKLDLAHLSPGIYTIKVRGKKGDAFTKFVKN